MLNYDTISDETQSLVDNQQPTAVTDNDEIYAGGFVDNGGEVAIVPATSTFQQPENDFHNVELQSHVQMSDAPNDKWNFTYLVFYLLGTATMTPWNFFITAEDVSSEHIMFVFKNTIFDGNFSPLFGLHSEHCKLFRMIWVTYTTIYRLRLIPFKH